MGTPPGYVEYHLVEEAVTWLESLAACPQRHPDWTLATVSDEREWLVMVGSMQAAWSAPGAPPVGFYNGAWVGLSSPDPVPAAVPSTGPWPPASNWQWAVGVQRDGASLSAHMASKWGAVGTGWSRDGQLRGQPDNSGGYQRCVLLAMGVNALPISTSRCALG
jgi:hypothetical protein